VLLTFLGIYIWAASIKNSDTIFPGVCVFGENLGGKTRQEAVEILAEKLTNAQKDRTLTVQLPDGVLVFEADQANPLSDVEKLADAAMNYGRDGGAFKALRMYSRCKKTGAILDVEGYRTINTEYIRQIVEEKAEQVLTQKTESVVVMNEETQVMTITLGYNGCYLDTEALVQQVEEAFREDVVSGFEFEYEIDPCDLVDLQPIYDQYCTPARNAYYNTAEQKMMPEVEGYGFDLVAVNAQIVLAAEGSVIEIQLGPIHPSVTVDQYNTQNFPDVLSSYQSAHTYDNNRTTNLRLACEAINGTVLEPGEVFSFNGLVGERTPERGYKDGIIYADGGASELEAGGGICQVVSSVYMCALMADLQIIERQPHMYPVGYVKAGCDATVYWGAVDFKFKNTNSTPIKVNAEVSNGMVKVSFVGTNEHDYTIKMTNQLIETIPYEEVETLDETKPAGYREQTQAPHTGYVYWSYKNYYDLDGNFLRTEKCAISEYAKYDAEFIVGPEDEEPEEDDDRDDDDDDRRNDRPQDEPDERPQEEEPADLGDLIGPGAGVNDVGNRRQYRN